MSKLNNRSTTVHLKKNAYRIISYFHNNIQHVNSSKLFAGLVVITLNLASRFVTLKISKTMESYLKFTLSRDILVFCIVWMGSREIYIALLFTILFNFVVDYLLNEDSHFCILPERFTSHHKSLLENELPTEEEIKNAKNVIKRANQKDGNLGE